MVPSITARSPVRVCSRLRLAVWETRTLCLASMVMTTADPRRAAASADGVSEASLSLLADVFKHAPPRTSAPPSPFPTARSPAPHGLSAARKLVLLDLDQTLVTTWRLPHDGWAWPKAEDVMLMGPSRVAKLGCYARPGVVSFLRVSISTTAAA